MPVPIGSYVTAMRNFLGDPDGARQWRRVQQSRAVGNLARPFFPDGITGTASRPAVGARRRTGACSTTACSSTWSTTPIIASRRGPDAAGLHRIARLANGIQIFPGSVPIYRGSLLVGAIGVSGDGIDQDDMVAFLGLANAGTALNNGIANAPTAIRTDNIAPQGEGTRLRYVNCPQSPFNDSSDQNVCSGI